MNNSLNLALICALSLASVPSMAQKAGLAKPQLLLHEAVRNMPRGDRQDVRVMTASFKPGDRTVFHTHRFPVTVYVLEGAFSLEMEGREPMTIRAGEAYVEPANVKMTGFNRSTADTLRVLIFYVSDPATPFLDPLE